VTQLCPQALGSLFIASYDSQGYGGGTRTRFSAGTTTTVLFVLVIQPRHGPHRKLLFHYCVFSRCWGNMSTELFPSKGCCTVACLYSCYLAMGLHVTTGKLQNCPQVSSRIFCKLRWVAVWVGSETKRGAVRLQTVITGSHLLNKFPAFLATRRFAAVFTRAHHWPPS
jgi:hypothetical protein